VRPIVTTSPGFRNTSRTRFPFTNVPFFEPRSRSSTPSLERTTSACLREAARSSSVSPASVPDPIVTLA
jgi:hypothetical protein